MTNLMSEMIKEATAKLNETGYLFACAAREINVGKLVVTVSAARNANSLAMHTTRNWTLNGKRISAAKVINL